MKLAELEGSVNPVHRLRCEVISDPILTQSRQSAIPVS